MINYKEFEQHLELAVKKCFAILKRKYYYTDIYIFALVIDYKYKHMGFTFNTNKYLEQAISEEEDTDYHIMYKLNHSDWYYATFNRTEQSELNENFYTIDKILEYSDCINRNALYNACKNAICKIRRDQTEIGDKPFMILSEDNEQYLYNDMLSMEYSSMINNPIISMDYQRLFDEFDLSVFDYSQLQRNIEDAAANSIKRLKKFNLFQDTYIYAFAIDNNYKSINFYFNTKEYLNSLSSEKKEAELECKFNPFRWVVKILQIDNVDFDSINHYLLEHDNVIEERVFYQTCSDAVKSLKDKKLIPEDIPFIIMDINPRESNMGLIQNFNSGINSKDFMIEFMEFIDYKCLSKK